MISPLKVRTPEFVEFTSIQAEYRDFIWNIAMQERLSGYQSVADLPELSDEDCQLVLRAKPDLVKKFLAEIQREVLSDVQAECDTSDGVASERQYGRESLQTDRERSEVSVLTKEGA